MERTNQITAIGELLPKQDIAKPFSEYSHIELTEEEKENALNYFRMLKGRQLDEDEKLQQKINKRKKLQEPWTYKQLKSAVLERARTLPFKFVIDNNNEQVFHLLCLYFSGSPEFENHTQEYSNGIKKPLSLKKGIALVSQPKGTGKTILMSLFQQNKFRPFIQIETKSVAARYQQRGDEAITVNSELIQIPPTPDFFMYERIGLCFGDLGFEVAKNHWGSKSDVMIDVISTIYEKNQHKGDYSFFHFTSNLYGPEFEERYDDRVRDRMREMFNVIILPGESRRL